MYIYRICSKMTSSVSVTSASANFPWICGRAARANGAAASHSRQNSETLALRRCTAMPPAPAPPSVERQVAEIAAEPDRASAYARLLHLQRACADDPSAAADLAAASPSILLPLLLRDAGDRDEAVAASALKCLGFTLYHPVLVSTVSGRMAPLYPQLVSEMCSFGWADLGLLSNCDVTNLIQLSYYSYSTFGCGFSSLKASRGHPLVICMSSK